jgi:hypothetical protein
MAFGFPPGRHPETDRYIALAKEQDMDRRRAEVERRRGWRSSAEGRRPLLLGPWRLFRRFVGRVDRIGPGA